MGHDSVRTAMIYQHEARGADKAITAAIDAHVDDERRQEDDGDDGDDGQPEYSSRPAYVRPSMLDARSTVACAPGVSFQRALVPRRAWPSYA